MPIQTFHNIKSAYLNLIIHIFNDVEILSSLIRPLNNYFIFIVQKQF